MFISQITNQYNQDPTHFSRDYFVNNLTPVQTGGRITAVRAQRTFFMTIAWGQSTVQIMCESTNPCLEALRSLHVGDVIEVEGTLMRSMRGELSIAPGSVVVNSRTEHNLELRRDFEGRGDNIREVNLMRNSQLMQNMYARSNIVQTTRQYMFERSFMEIETPMLHDNPSGASARTFETHCNANDHRYHLRIAPEIYLVRSLMAGFEQIFEIGHNFRNEGISNRHQPEFTMMECYRAFSDYVWAMDFVEELLHFLGARFGCTALTENFSRLTYQQALIQYHPVIANNAYPYMGFNNAQSMIENRDWLISQLPQNRDYSDTNLGMLQYMVFETIDSLIMEPTFVTNHPVQISPLAQAIDGTQETERFELFINGRELGNGFSQLIDLPEQRRRFEMQSMNLADDAMRTDHVYMDSMSYGFPRIGGFGIGIDRLVMLLTNQDNIRDVVLFPLNN